MGRQKNDGRGRLGGRAKGTPNKATSTLKEWLEQLLNDNREQVEADLKALKKPYERLKIIERLLGYVLPKQQPVDAEKVVQAEFKELDRLLDTKPDEVLDILAEKVMKMQQEQKDRGLTSLTDKAE